MKSRVYSHLKMNGVGRLSFPFFEKASWQIAIAVYFHGSKLPEFSPVTIIRLSGKTSQEIPSCKVGSYQL